MRRVLFRCFGVPIYSYPAMLYFGLVLGIYAQLAAAASIGLSVWRLLMVTLPLVATALFGARLLFVWQRVHVYRARPERIWRFAEGGAALYGGLLLAVPLSLPLLAAFAIPFGVFWDVTTFTLLIGLIITRFGCFLNGCCAGQPSSGWFALNLPDQLGVWTRRIPVQMLEAAWAALLLIGAVVLWRRLPFHGALFLYAAGAYGAARVLLERLRLRESSLRAASLHTAISVLLVVISLVAFARPWWQETSR